LRLPPKCRSARAPPKSAKECERPETKNGAMKSWTIAALFAATLCAVITGCAKQSSSTDSQATASAESSPSVVVSAEASGAEAASPEATEAATASASAGSGASAVASAAAVSYDDVHGIFAEKAIKDLATLGVFGTASGGFHPNGPISRGEFVEWLVKANNAIYASDPAKQIRLAETGDATFPDVPSSSPYFAYIQGMNNAGYAVGFGDKLFHPNDRLSREQLLALKIGVDAGQVKARPPSEFVSTWTYVPAWNDKETIEKKYRDAFIEGYYSTDKYGNTGRIWGTLKTLGAHKDVTRSEAALGVSAFYPHDPNPSGKPDTAADAVAKAAAATATP
jgi:hypothetical protein